MNELEHINRYIERTKLGRLSAYQLRIQEGLALADAARVSPADMICLAFEYGMAKGYRAARAEAKKEAI